MRPPVALPDQLQGGMAVFQVFGTDTLATVGDWVTLAVYAMTTRPVFRAANEVSQ
jgi:hypothetical protein